MYRRALLLSAAIVGALGVVGCEPEEPSGQPEPKPKHRSEIWFADITDAAGLDFSHRSGATGKLLLPEIMGGGVALFDFDNDGDLDIYLVDSGVLPAEIGGAAGIDAGASPGAGNQLYRQESDGRFVNVSGASGLDDRGYGMGVAVGDVDNDGHQDVYVTNFGNDRLLHNNGDGTFQDVTHSAGVDVPGWSSSAAFLDYDSDGWLDLFVCRFVQFDPQKKCFDQAGRADYCGPMAYPPEHDVLLHNRRDGTFEDVSVSSGIAALRATGLGVVCDDFNDDGLVDMYVANDGYANHLWTNLGDGTFRNDAMLMGIALNIHGHAEAGMGVLADDLDQDGDVDLFMTHLGDESNTYYENLGGGVGFRDDSASCGLGMPSLEYTGFGTCAFDVELDGDLDIVVANGRVRWDSPRSDTDLPPPWNTFAEPNLFFVNAGSGKFYPKPGLCGSLCSRVEISRGLAAGDVDGDGDIDLLIGRIESRPRLYRNDAPREGHWLAIRARDDRYHRDAIGARVIVFGGDRQWRRIVSGGHSYASSSPAVAHFGLGDVRKVDRIEIRWPDGLVERFDNVTIDATITFVRGAGIVRQPEELENVSKPPRVGNP